MRFAAPHFAAVWLLLVTGCGTTGGARWYAPATWFSHAPADRRDKAVAAQTAASDDAVKAAQVAVHQTAVALSKAPSSRPVEVAIESNGAALALLDQAAGVLPADVLGKINQVVSDLMSDNAKIREKAEAQRAKDLKTVERISTQLAAATNARDEAEAKLRQAFDRENKLANEYRSELALRWIAVGVAVLAAAGWVYIRFFLGGIPSALALAKSRIERDHPEIAQTIAPYYRDALSARQKRAIKLSQ